jgi:hypothetical protein
VDLTASEVLKPCPQDRRVHTVQELRSAVEESGLPAYRVEEVLGI